MKVNVVSNVIFEDMKNINQFTITFHILDHVAEDKSSFEMPNYLDAFFSENFKFQSKSLLERL